MKAIRRNVSSRPLERGVYLNGDEFYRLKSRRIEKLEYRHIHPTYPSSDPDVEAGVEFEWVGIFGGPAAGSAAPTPAKWRRT